MRPATIEATDGRARMNVTVDLDKVENVAHIKVGNWIEVSDSKSYNGRYKITAIIADPVEQENMLDKVIRIMEELNGNNSAST